MSSTPPPARPPTNEVEAALATILRVGRAADAKGVTELYFLVSRLQQLLLIQVIATLAAGDEVDAKELELWSEDFDG